MPRLDESIEALTAAPESVGLQLVYPAPRMDWCQLPVDVSECRYEQHAVRLKYRIQGGLFNHFLVQGDVIWHSGSNMLAMVIERTSLRECRAIGLVAPDTEEEYESFKSTGHGAGTWCVVAMGWLPEWDIPTELYNKLPHLVELGTQDSQDAMPAGARSRKGWVAEGRINPDRPLDKAQRKFFRRQRAAMGQMVQALEHMDPEELEQTQLPKPGELAKGEAVETIIPLEPPKPKSRILSYPGQGKRSKPDE